MKDAKNFLIERIFEEGYKYFGIKDKRVAINIANDWHNDNTDHTSCVAWRWDEAETFGDHKGKVLDLACGVGTFLFYGLKKGFDVYGVEPEEWKLKYMNLKIEESNYPVEWKNRIFRGYAEKLPFDDNYFDYIITYQTLEHVQDLDKSISEIIRVTKPGGRIKIHAPDYNSFYEPHYLIPFLPCMNRGLAKRYLKIVKKPTSGLNTLKWTTSKKLIETIMKHDIKSCIDVSEARLKRSIKNIKSKNLINRLIPSVLIRIFLERRVYFAKEERHINLIIQK